MQIPQSTSELGNLCLKYQTHCWVEFLLQQKLQTMDEYVQFIHNFQDIYEQKKGSSQSTQYDTNTWIY